MHLLRLGKHWYCSVTWKLSLFCMCMNEYRSMKSLRYSFISTNIKFILNLLKSVKYHINFTLSGRTLIIQALIQNVKMWWEREREKEREKQMGFVQEAPLRNKTTQIENLVWVVLKFDKCFYRLCFARCIFSVLFYDFLSFKWWFYSALCLNAEK